MFVQSSVSLGPTAISYASCMGFLLYRLGFVSRAAPCCDRRNVWWRDWIITYYKLTSLFHQDGKGSVSWSLNITNVNIKININVGTKGTSSHETSHISTSEICEFRVHSTPPRFKMNNIVLQSKIINNRTKNISFKFPTCSGYLLSSFKWDKTHWYKCLLSSFSFHWGHGPHH